MTETHMEMIKANSMWYLNMKLKKKIKDMEAQGWRFKDAQYTRRMFYHAFIVYFQS